MIVALIGVDGSRGLPRRNCLYLRILRGRHHRSEAALELDNATSRLSGRPSGQGRRTS
jgi:hypothetical protein